MTKITIQVIERKLSDASLVYDVHMTGGIVLPATTERDAHHLVDKLSTAIAAHTNEIVDVWP